jgi:hypothetical protein
VCAGVRTRERGAPRGPCAACPSGWTARQMRATLGGSRALRLRRAQLRLPAQARPPPCQRCSDDYTSRRVRRSSASGRNEAPRSRPSTGPERQGGGGRVKDQARELRACGRRRAEARASCCVQLRLRHSKLGHTRAQTLHLPPA